MKLKVIIDCFYISDGRSFEWEYLTKQELFNIANHLLVVGDIWETSTEYPELLICTSGVWEGEYNEGWWEYEDVSKFFEVIG